MSDSNSPTSSASPNDAASTNPKPTTRVVYKQTARMRTMCTSMAAEGKQFAAPSHPTPVQKPMQWTTKRRRRQPSPDWSSSEEQPDDDPEDDPDNEYVRRPLKIRKEKDSEDDSDSSSDSDETDEEETMGVGFDESDEEERGDQSRRSPDCTDRFSMNDYSRDSDNFATQDGDDSDS